MAFLRQKTLRAHCPECEDKGGWMEVDDWYKYQLREKGGYRLVTCKLCKGRKRRLYLKLEMCTKCDSSGIESYKPANFGEQGDARSMDPVTCTQCRGKGKTISCKSKWAKPYNWEFAHSPEKPKLKAAA